MLSGEGVWWDEVLVILSVGVGAVPHACPLLCLSRTQHTAFIVSCPNMQAAPTIVMTQRGARKHFQQMLRSKGVEVVEFDFLTPEAVADYCYERGFLQVRVCMNTKDCMG